MACHTCSCCCCCCRCCCCWIAAGSTALTHWIKAVLHALRGTGQKTCAASNVQPCVQECTVFVDKDVEGAAGFWSHMGYVQSGTSKCLDLGMHMAEARNHQFGTTVNCIWGRHIELVGAEVPLLALERHQDVQCCHHQLRAQ
jgi:hypothetical protein